MRYIAHRGNISGIDETKENLPSHILEVLSCGYDVEIDLRKIGEKLFLGHDFPQYEVDFSFLVENRNLWIHCKNIEAAHFLSEKKRELDFNNNFFWHQNDDITLTSEGYLFTFPGKTLTDMSIAVMPEWSVDITNFEKCYGVCSDFVKNIKEGNFAMENGRMVAK